MSNSNICQFCGGQYVFKDGHYVCPYCGYFKPEELSEEENILLTAASQKLRLANFDEAEEAYGDIIMKYPTHPDGYWGFVLARYGVKYEQDYDGKMLPSCYATSMNSFVDDTNYLKAVQYGSDKQKEYYLAQAQKIELIRKTWVEKAQKEEPYDIFISYKDSDKEKGIDRTEDSIKAYELYNQLSKEGYRVFYSRESLAQNTGEKYEPYIFNALNTAKVMVLYSSSVEYIESTWIKNEWLRYYKRIRNGEKQSNSLIICYDGFDPSKLPRPLNQIQALNVGSLTFLQDLKNVVKNIMAVANKVVPKIDRIEVKSFKQTDAKKLEKTETRTIGNYSVGQITIDNENQLKVAEGYIAKGMFKEANIIVSQVLAKNPRSSKALLLNMLISSSNTSIDELIAKIDKFNDYNAFSQYIEVANSEEALSFLDKLSKTCLKLLDTGKFDIFDRLYTTISAYGVSIILELHKNVYKKIKTFVPKNMAIATKYVLVAAQYIANNNQDLFVKILSDFAMTCLKNSQYKDAETYYKMAIEYKDGDPQLYWGLIYSICEINNGDISVNTEKLTDISLVERLYLSYQTPEEQLEAIQKIILGCIRFVSVNNVDENNKVFETFFEVLRRIPEDSNTVYVTDLKKMARICLEKGHFTNSEKYYAMILEAEPEDHQSHWGLLQSKIKCKNDDEVIGQDVLIGELIEFNNAVNTAVKENQIEAFNHYTDVKIQQEKAIKKREEDAIKLKKKKKRNKIIALVACIVCMCIAGGLGGFFAYRAQTKLKYDGSSVYAGKYFEEEDVVIPVSKDGTVIKEIAANAFAGDTTIKTLTLPTSLEVIGENAFKGCTSLTSIKFEDVDNSNIAYAANGTSEKTISLKKICQSAFEGCTSLVKFDMPNSVEEIESKVFKGTGLKEVTLSSSIKTIGSNAFSGTAISKISLPKSLENVGDSIFEGCNDLKTINFEDRLSYPTNWGDKWISSSTTKSESIEIVCLIEVKIENANGEDSYITDIEYKKSFTLDVPTKDGYIFMGYFDEENGEGTQYVNENGNSLFAFNRDAGITLFAYWQAKVNTLIFDGNGATSGAMENNYVVTDDTITLPDNLFNKEGYTFLGWAITNKGSVRYLNKASFTMNSSPSTTLFAIWKLTTNTITYDLDGGVISLSNPSSYTYLSDDILLNNPTKAGYEFSGWFDGNTLSSSYVIKKNSFGNLSLVATYEANLNTLSFNANDSSHETIGSMNDIQIKTDAEATLPNYGFAKAGYSFMGWSSTSGGEVEYQNEALYKMGTNQNYTLYAVWGADENIIKLDGNGSQSEKMDDVKVKTNGRITLPSNTYYKAGYTFAGWSEVKGGKLTYLDGALYTMNRDFDERTENTYSLYAVWELITYTITYDLNGGVVETPNPVSYTIETESFTLNNPIKAGCSFLYWIDGDGFGINNMEVIKGSIGDKSFTTQYLPESNTLYFDGNGATLGTMENMSLSTDEVKPLLANKFTKDYYEFVGWAESQDGDILFKDGDFYTMYRNFTTRTTNSYTLYAVWYPLAYAINYYLFGGEVKDSNLTSYTIESDDITLNNPERDGYEFTGWTGTGLSDKTKGVTIVKGSTGERNYTANWEPIVYTISYDLVSGNVSTQNETTYTIISEPISVCPPTREGYDFIGWSGTDLGELTLDLIINTGNFGDRNYTANWLPKVFSITYELNGGEVETSNPDSYTIEDSAITLHNPTRAGYTFIGWTGSQLLDYTMIVTIPAASIDNRSYIAHWTPKLNTIIFNGNGATSGIVAPINGYTDEYVRIPQNTYVKNEYTFIGWSKAANSDIVAYDRDLYQVDANSINTLYAVWEYDSLYHFDRTSFISISSAQDLLNIKNDLNGKYYLTCDIDMFGYEWEPIGSYNKKQYSNLDNSFKGIFDGNGYSIYNLSVKESIVYSEYVNSYCYDYYYGFGLFGYSEGIICNVQIIHFNATINFQFSSDNVSFARTDEYHVYGGAICAYSNGGTISNCYAQGDAIVSSPINIETTGSIYGKNYLRSINIGGISGTGVNDNKCYSDINISINQVACIGIVVPDTDSDTIMAQDYHYWETGYINYQLINGTQLHQLAKWHSIVIVRDTIDKKAGYSLSGWSTTENGELEYSVGTEIFIPLNKTSLTLYPVWQGNANTIIFNANKGSGTMNPQQIASDTTEALNACSYTKAGYHFIGWSTTLDGAVVYNDCALYSMGISSSVTLFAQWEKNTNTVRFDANGGSGNMPDQSGLTGDTISLNPNMFTDPVGYTFIGWSTVKNGDKAYNNGALYPIGTDGLQILYAKYQPIVYTISYSMNGGTNDSTNPYSYTIEDEITLKHPTRYGYTFIGWTGTDVEDKTLDLTVSLGSTNNREFTAYWELTTFTIEYVLMEGIVDGTNAETFTIYSDAITLINPTKDYYTFIGWTGADLTETTLNVTIPSNSIYNRIYTANYTPIKYTISYTLNGGEVATQNPSTFNVETETFTLNNPERAGYTFAGWTGTGINEATNIVEITLGSYGDKTFVATWNTIPYTISYELNGGSVSVSNPENYTIESNSITLNNPTKIGYDFAGWTGTGLEEQTKVATISSGSIGNRSYTANWTPTTYSITYDLKGGSVAGTNPASYNIETATFTLINPTRTGYTFDGWSGTNIEGKSTNVSINLGSIDAKSYTANWTAIVYNITYDYKDGSVATANPTTYTIETESFTLTNPTRTGYTFDGWSGTGIGGKSTSVTISKGSTGARTYTANWTAITYSVSFELNGGSFGYTPYAQYTIETSYILPTPSKDGSSFQGWSGDGIDGKKTEYTIPIGSTGNKTFTANWREHTYVDGVCTGCGKYQSEGVYYVLSDDKTYYIVAGRQTTEAKATGDIYIAGTYEGKPVKEIRMNAFSNSANITSIHIPSTITTIEHNAFSSDLYTTIAGVSYVDNWAVKYDEVAINVSLRSTTIGIAEETFESNYVLQSATLNSGLKYINDHAFYGARVLTSVNIPNTVISLGEHVFDSCDKLPYIAVPSSITSLPYGTFYGCDVLKSITLPNTLTSIGNHVFTNCGIKSLVLPDSITYMGEYVFSGCYEMEYISLPSGISSIPKETFGQCSGLKTVVIKDGVQTIASDAFVGCNSISAIYYKGTAAEWTSISGYNNAKFASATIYYYQEKVPEVDFENECFIGNYWMYDSYKNLTVWDYEEMSNLLSYELVGDEYQVIGYDATTTNPVLLIPSNYEGKAVTTIKDSAFRGNTIITNILLGKNVTTINSYAFKGCTGLVSVAFPESLINISSYAFEGCSSLSSVVLGKNVSNLNTYAFDNTVFTTYQGAYYLPTKDNQYAYFVRVIDNALTSYSIHSNTMVICSRAFYYCSGMTTISIPNNVKIIGKEAFKYCSGLTAVSMPTGLKTINDYAFSDCTKLATLTLSNTIECIGPYAFYNCSKLSQLSIPEGVTEIGAYAFYNCSLINRVNMPSTMTSIGNNAFENCTSIFSVYITSLENWVAITFGNEYSNPTMYSKKIFLNEVKIEDLVIPNGVTAISNYAFYCCSTFTSITLPNTLLTVGNKSFYGCSTVTEIDFGESIVTIGEEAFSGCYKATTIELPNSLITIKKKAFDNCSITSLNLGNSVETIESYAFDDSYQLYELTLPNSIKYIESYAFYCVGAQLLRIPSGTYVDRFAFSKSSIRRVIIGKDSTIDSYAFNNCSISNVYFEGTENEWIGTSAFAGATRYYYSELEPNGNSDGTGYDNNYWRYDINGDISVWSTSDYLKTLYSYTLNSDNSSYTLNGFTSGKRRTAVVIAEEHNGLPITKIADNAFLNETGITSLTISNNITSIGNYAFKGCAGLIKVFIPNTVINLGNYVFSACTNLEYVFYDGTEGNLSCGTLDINVYYYKETEPEINIAKTGYEGYYWYYIDATPVAWGSDESNSSLYAYTLNSDNSSYILNGFASGKSVKNVFIPTIYNGLPVSIIAASAFLANNNIINVIVSDTTLKINSSAFASCSNLKYCRLGNGITTIGENAFYNCQKVDELIIGTGLLTVGKNAFQNDVINKVYINNLTKWCGISFAKDKSNPIMYANSVYISNKKTTKLTIPSGVTSISTYAFTGWNQLTSVTIPSSVSKINSAAFSCCYNLVEVYNLSSSLTITKGLTDNGMVSYYALDVYSSTSTSSKISTNANGYLFYTNSDGVALINYIGENTELILPNSATRINQYAFYNNKRITSIVIPSGYTIIGNNAFEGCSNLISVTIPNTITDIQSKAFKDASAIGRVNISDLSSWCNITFGSYHANPQGTLYIDNEPITTLNIPNDIEAIKNYAFYGNTSIKTINISSSVLSIGYCAFKYCTSIKSVTIPDSVINIEYETFMGCSELTNCTLPNNISLIANSLFYGCEKLSTISIPNSVTSISNAAFYGCSNLLMVIMGNKVETILNGAFNGCTRLMEVCNLSSLYIVAQSSDFGGVALYAKNVYTATEGQRKMSIDGFMSVKYVEGSEKTLVHSYLTYDNMFMSEDITSIGEYCFKNMTFMTSVTIRKSVTSIKGNAFYGCSNLASVFYEGTEEEWNEINIDSNNYYLTNATRYYYSETRPTETGNYWHYNGSSLTPVIWTGDTYTISYLLNGGTNNKSNITSYTVTDSNFTLQAPSGDSLFCGWYLNDANGECITTIDTSLGQDIILYALFDGTKGLTISGNTITGYSGSATEIIIPTKYNGVTLTTIGENAFANNSTITSIIIPREISSIGSSAFVGCSAMNAIYYFGTQEDWNKINIAGNNVPLTNAIRYCYSTTRPTIAGNYWCLAVDGVTKEKITVYAINYIMNGGTNNSSNPTVYMIADDDITLLAPTGDGLFCGWYLNDANGEYVTTIDTSLGQDITLYALFDGTKGLTISGNTITGYSGSASAVTIPAKYNGVAITTIEIGAFKDCSTITSVTIPSGITSMGSNSFANCSQLQTVNYNAVDCSFKANSNDDSIFVGCSNLTTIIIGNGVTCIPDSFVCDCTSLTTITMAYTVTSIGDYAFIGCSGLKSLYIGSGVKAIGERAFANCTEITDVYCYDLKTIGENAFEGCTKISAVHMQGNTNKTDISIESGNESLTSASWYVDEHDVHD